MSQKSALIGGKETEFVRGLWICNGVVFALLTGGALLWGSASAALSVVVGGVIALANFKLMQRAITKTLTPQARASLAMGSMLLKYYLRFAVTVLVLGVLISQGMVEPVGLLLGLSVVVITIITWGVVSVRKLG